LIIIGLAIFLVTTDNDNSTDKDSPLTTTDPKNVEHIQIIRRDLDDITFKKQDNRWFMQHPYTITANPVRINTLLGVLQAHSYTQFDVAEVMLDRFMLDDPLVSIQIDEDLIEFGDTNPLERLRYVLFNNTVHLINDSLYQQLLAPATFFINPRLIPAGNNISEIHLPENHLSLFDGSWVLSPPSEISMDKINQLASAWRDISAIMVRDYIQGDSNEKIKIKLQADNIFEFVVVSREPQLILARPDLNIQYHISNYDADRLFFSEENEDHNNVSEQLPDAE
jgi:hypothetical protein